MKYWFFVTKEHIVQVCVPEDARGPWEDDYILEPPENEAILEQSDNVDGKAGLASSIGAKNELGGTSINFSTYSCNIQNFVDFFILLTGWERIIFWLLICPLMIVTATCYLKLQISSSSLLTKGPEQTESDQREAGPAETYSAALLAAGQAVLWHKLDLYSELDYCLAGLALLIVYLCWAMKVRTLHHAFYCRI